MIARNVLGKIDSFGNINPIEFQPIGDRGIFGSGIKDGSLTNTIDYISISSESDAQTFGSLLYSRAYLGATSNGNNSRGVFGGGYIAIFSSYLNEIDYITITSLGNGQDFADLTDNRANLSSTSNGLNDRGLFGGGWGGGDQNIVDYITISSLTNAINFGDITTGRQQLAATSNSTNERGVFGGGISSNVIDYVTISSIGNATDFGDLVLARRRLASTSNGTNGRGVFGGGYSATNVIDYVNIDTTGNAQDFGDLTIARDYLAATSNGVDNRGVFGGGTSVSILDYINIISAGNAVTFGSFPLGLNRSGFAATSDA